MPIKFHASGDEFDLVYELHKHLGQFEKARPHHILHASAVTNTQKEFCPRQYALMDITQKADYDEYLSTSLNVTFAIGNVLQEKTTHDFADMGMTVGDWRCTHCGYLVTFSKRPDKCTSCKGKHFKPYEVRFESKITGMSCGIDLLLDTGNGKHRVIEIKTIDKEKFKSLSAPLAEHRQRTVLYLDIINEAETLLSERVDTSKAYILYISKGGYGCANKDLAKKGLKGEGFSPFKSYEVTPASAKIDKPKQLSKMVKDFRQGTQPIPLGICPTTFCKRAKHCCVVHECFSGDHPGEAHD